MMSFTKTTSNLLKTLAVQLKSDIGFQNSLYLIASTGVMAASGFIFWIIGARLYTPQEIGLSSTLVAAATTLALFSLLGFDNVLIRYLPGSKKPDQVIDTSLIITSIAALVLSVGFLLTLKFTSPSLHGLLSSPFHIAFFIISLVLVTINTLTDSIFISYRSAKYILIANTGLSLGKVIFPLALVAYGAYGLFIAYAVSVTLASFISVLFLGKSYKYRFKPVIDRATLKEVQKFSAGTYTSNLVAALPMMALPIIVTNALGGEQAAYFNLAMTIAAMLFIVPRSTANSLFAEISKEPDSLTAQTIRTIKQTSALLIPLIILISLGSHTLLSIFGAAYASGASAALQVLAISALGLGLNVIAQTLLKVRHKLMSLFIIQLIGSAITIALCWPLAKIYGAQGAAWAWLIGQYVMAGAHCFVVLPLLHREKARHFDKAAPTFNAKREF